MTTTLILTIFFILVILQFLVSSILSLMNLNNSLKHRDGVPDFIAPYISLLEYDRTVEYTQRKGKFSLAALFINSAATILAVAYKIPALLLEWLNGFGLGAYSEGMIFLFLLSFLSFLVTLPVSLYSQFVIEEEFRFNKMTFGLFFTDTIKEAVVSVVLFVPLLLGLFFFIDKTGSLWWLYAFLFFAAFQFLLTVLYPLVIAPLFNRFAVLEDGPLKDRLTALADKTAFKTQGIYKMDGSRRSAHSNAYFTGFGKGRRIVLFDTLMDRLSDAEIEAVLAHEIGHYRKKHILKGMFISLVTVFLLLFLLSLFMDYTPLYKAFGFPSSSMPALIVILSFVMEPVIFLFKPLFSFFSRKNEYEADRFAADATGESRNLADALIKLGRDNLSNLTPHSLYSAFHYSHPVLKERIEALKKS